MDDAEWEKFRGRLKEEWKSLWRERIDDKLRAEGIANRDYDMLFLDRGTVIFASRDAKIPGFREVLEMWAPQDIPYAVPPDPRIGGWRKFIRTELRKGAHSRARVYNCQRKLKGEKQHLRKGGCGWLHIR